MKACASQDDLVGLLEEQLNDAALEQLIDHLGECEDCRNALLKLSVDTTDWSTWEAMLQTSRMTWPCTTAAQPELPDFQKWPTIPGYEILQVLGTGGMGIVYKARQLALGRLVALKVMREAWQDDGEFQARFRREAETLARMHHPNMVQIYDVLDCDNRPVLVLELVDGESLAETLRDKSLPPRTAANLVEILAVAMHSAHLKGIVHRDIKPANILIPAAHSWVTGESDPSTASNETDHSGSKLDTKMLVDTAVGDDAPAVKLTDFGLARSIESNGNTTTGQMMGTPCYMSPEQAREAPGWSTPAVDIYALGAVLYEAITGRPPHRGESSYATLMKIVTDEPVMPSRIVPDLPRDLESITLKCLAKSPAQRYQTCDELAADLQKFRLHRPVLARPAPIWSRVARWARRHPMISALSFTSAAAVLVLLVGWIQFTNHLTSLNTKLAAETALATRRQQEAQAARDKARSDLFHMGQTLRQFGEIFRDEKELNAPALLPLRKRLVTLSLDSYADLLKRFGQDEQLTVEIAEGYYWLGMLTHESGNTKVAIDYLDTAIGILSPITDDRALAYLSTFLMDQGLLLAMAEQTEKSRAAYLRVIDILEEKLLPGTDDDATLAHHYHLLANARYQLGGTLRDEGKPEEAIGQLLAGRNAILLRLDVDVPVSVAFRRKAAMIERILGPLLYQSGRVDAGKRSLESAVAHAEEAWKTEPGQPTSRQGLATSYAYLATWYERQQQHAEALKLLKKALAVREKLAADYPHVPGYATELGSLYESIARCQKTLHRPADAGAAYRQSIACYLGLARQSPRQWSYASAVAKAMLKLAALDGHKDQEMPEQLTESISLLERWSNDPDEARRALVADVLTVYRTRASDVDGQYRRSENRSAVKVKGGN